MVSAVGESSSFIFREMKELILPRSPAKEIFEMKKNIMMSFDWIFNGLTLVFVRSNVNSSTCKLVNLVHNANICRLEH
jgi:hypothetical protein